MRGRRGEWGRRDRGVESKPLPTEKNHKVRFQCVVLNIYVFARVEKEV